MAKKCEETTVTFVMRKYVNKKGKTVYCVTIPDSDVKKNTSRVILLTRGDNLKKKLEVSCADVCSRNAFDPPWREKVKLKKGEYHRLYVRSNLGLDKEKKPFKAYRVTVVAGWKDKIYPPCLVEPADHNDFHIEC